MSVFTVKEYRLTKVVIEDILSKEDVSTVEDLLNLLESKSTVKVNEDYVKYSKKADLFTCPSCGGRGNKAKYTIDKCKIIRCPRKCGWSSLRSN